jgi:hypothetical protein
MVDSVATGCYLIFTFRLQTFSPAVGQSEPVLLVFLLSYWLDMLLFLVYNAAGVL